MMTTTYFFGLVAICGLITQSLSKRAIAKYRDTATGSSELREEQSKLLLKQSFTFIYIAVLVFCGLSLLASAEEAYWNFGEHPLAIAYLIYQPVRWLLISFASPKPDLASTPIEGNFSPIEIQPWIKPLHDFQGSLAISSFGLLYWVTAGLLNESPPATTGPLLFAALLGLPYLAFSYFRIHSKGTRIWAHVATLSMVGLIIKLAPYLFVTTT